MFPLLGGIIIFCSFGYFLLGIKESRQIQNSSNNDENKEETENNSITSYSPYHWIFMILLGLFFFFYVGGEVCYGVYLTTYAVKSPLGKVRYKNFRKF